MILNLRYIKVWLTASLLCIASFCLLLSSPTLHASELVYTIQTGSFSSEAMAMKQFKFIKHKLSGEKTDFLRIEKVGKFYAVRLGKFKDRINTERVFKDVVHLFDGALIMTAYIKENRTKRIYNTSLSGDKSNVENKSPSLLATNKVRLAPGRSVGSAKKMDETNNTASITQEKMPGKDKEILKPASANPDLFAHDMLNPPPSIKRDIFSAGKWWQNPKRKSEETGRGKLQLTATIIDDQGSIAIIDDKVLGVGESVKGLKIAAIKNDEVLLSKGNQQYILRMNEK